MTAEKAAYTLAEAAARTPWGVDTIRRAIHATDPTAFPPPLRAKVTSRDKNGKPRRQIVLASDLEAWLASLPDA